MQTKHKWFADNVNTKTETEMTKNFPEKLKTCISQSSTNDSFEHFENILKTTIPQLKINASDFPSTFLHFILN